MLKKVCMILTVILLSSVLSISAFAAVGDSIYDASTKSTDQFMVTITRPDGDESTFKQNYVICGVTDQEGVTVELLREDGGKFVDFKNTDDESRWKVGSSGVFMKEVVFPNKGRNKIRIVAYKDSDNGKFQLNDFTITVLEEGVKDKIINGNQTVNEMLDGIFNKN